VGKRRFTMLHREGPRSWGTRSTVSVLETLEPWDPPGDGPEVVDDLAVAGPDQTDGLGRPDARTPRVARGAKPVVLGRTWKRERE
jgi:hypothetical protein